MSPVQNILTPNINHTLLKDSAELLTGIKEHYLHRPSSKVIRESITILHGRNPIAGVQRDRDQARPAERVQLLLQPVWAGRLPRGGHLQGEAEGGVLRRGRCC